jgi:hypothetical protein
MATSSGGVSKGALWAGRVISALPVFALLMSATMKFMRPPAVVEGFHKFGYPDRLLLVLGIVEVSCTIVYLIPQTAVLGAILLTGYLGGATATHVRIGDPGFITPVLCGVLVWVGLFLRDRRVRVLIPLRS